jgi:hypothetical protein
MEIDWDSVFWGVVGIFSTCFVFFLQNRKKKSIKKNLKDLDLHLEYVSRLRGSQEYLFGMAFFAVFIVTFFISLGLLLPAAGRYFNTLLPYTWVGGLANALSMLFFMLAVIVSFVEALNFRDFSNFERTQARIEKKKAKLIEDLSNA